MPIHGESSMSSMLDKAIDSALANIKAEEEAAAAKAAAIKTNYEPPSEERKAAIWDAIVDAAQR